MQKKIALLRLPRWRPDACFGKTFQNLLLENRWTDWTETSHTSSATKPASSLRSRSCCDKFYCQNGCHQICQNAPKHQTTSVCKPFNQLTLNLAGIILGTMEFKYGKMVFFCKTRWPPDLHFLLKFKTASLEKWFIWLTPKLTSIIPVSIQLTFQK